MVYKRSISFNTNWYCKW